MMRSVSTTLLVLLTTTAPAWAADYLTPGPDLRPSYPTQWEMGEDSGLHIEAGVRYWYSFGAQKHQIGPYTQTMDTKTHAGEVFVRVDDRPTRSYLEASGAYGVAHEGTYTTNGGPAVNLPAARLGYGAADFGWLPFGTDQASFGFVTGYHYTYDSPDTGRANYTTAKSSSDIAWSNATGLWSVGADSKTNDFHVHGLKLGVAGRIDMGMFDITGEAAATPYAWVSGTAGSAQVGPNGPFAGGPFGATSLQASPAAINGFGYGASGKLMFGLKPTENLAVRFGGRASYLQGAYDVTWDQATITHPTANPSAPPAFSAPTLAKQGIISNNNPFSMLRYGLLVEVSGRF
ncbi:MULTISPECIES: hypothetical protein [Devosia]|nr:MULTISPECIES: hypothetical protein [Devosia]